VAPCTKWNSRTARSYGVVRLDVRQRSARVQILQDNLDRMLQVKAARALEHADHPGGASGLLVAIEEGQSTEKRDLTGSLSIAAGNALLTAGRDRLAAEKKAALDRGEEWS
jgi:hypothetical protein